MKIDDLSSIQRHGSNIVAIPQVEAYSSSRMRWASLSPT